MNILTSNRGFVVAAALIVTGLFGLIDSASANYDYKHNPRHNYKFDSHHNRHHGSYGHGYSNRAYNYGHQSGRHSYKKYYKRHYKHHYSPSRRYYKKPYYNRRHEQRYYDDQYYGHRHYDNRRTYRKHNKHYSSKNRPHCYSYKVTSYGGQGGFRFQHDKDAFKRINNNSYVSKICGYDSVEFELSKVQPGVSISIEINGKYFNYPAHSGHDRYINNWHRKYFSVNFKRY